MSTLFDTSVLVAALVEAHPHHTRAFPLVRAVHAGAEEGIVSTHSLAELYSVLTSLPHRPRITPRAANALVTESVESRFHVVGLGRPDYRAVLRTLSSEGLAGGIVYDALLARAAAKSGAARIATMNRRDFERLRAIFAGDIVVP